MFTSTRRWISTIGVVLTFGLVNTSAMPVVTGSTGVASAKTKTVAAKKTNRTRQS